MDRFLLCLLSLAVAFPGHGDSLPEAVVPGYAFRFPPDHGAHPDFRTEWWYATGWLQVNGKLLGFQITFFRSRIAGQEANPSRFAPKQILMAHAAISDPARSRLLHDQRVARSGFGLAEAASGEARVVLDGWRFEQDGSGFRADIPAADFHLDLMLQPTQPVLLQGDDGFSRKGPKAESASYYYTLPHLAVTGTIERDGVRQGLSGEAWLDHEWSSQYMDAEAEGWDWVGLNLDDGNALMAFAMRKRGGGTLWAGGTLRDRQGKITVFKAEEVRFEPRRTWHSPRTGVNYPVAMTLRAGTLTLELDPLMDDQEHDARRSVGTVYYEGAVTARDGSRTVGHGYLELTGYWKGKRLERARP